MKFFDSLIRQIGRDAGKTISNKIFKDKHSTPYRRVNKVSNKQSSARTRAVRKPISEFENSIKINLGLRPPTLLSKISASFVFAKNEIEEMISDNYLDNAESEYLMNIFTQFIDKVEDISDVLRYGGHLNEKNKERILLLKTDFAILFQNTVAAAIQGSKDRIEYHTNLAKGIDDNRYFWQTAKKNNAEQNRIQANNERERVAFFEKLLNPS